jgi:hypothetical protein
MGIGRLRRPLRRLLQTSARADNIRSKTRTVEAFLVMTHCHMTCDCQGLAT